MKIIVLPRYKNLLNTASPGCIKNSSYRLEKKFIAPTYYKLLPIHFLFFEKAFRRSSSTVVRPRLCCNLDAKRIKVSDHASTSSDSVSFLRCSAIGRDIDNHYRGRGERRGETRSRRNEIPGRALIAGDERDD